MINSELTLVKFRIYLIFFVLLSVAGMIYTPLFDEDEGMYAEAARHMLGSGDWVQISVNGELRYDKPPLAIWLEALCLWVFRLNEFGARLPSFLAFLAWLVLLFRYARYKMNVDFARKLVVIISSSLYLQLLGKAALTDNLLTLLLTVSLVSFDLFFEKRLKTFLYLFYVSLGLAFLTKGPVAWVIPGGVIFIYLIFKNEIRFLLKLFSIPGILLLFGIPLLWFVPAFRASGEFVFTDFFLKHNLSRFSGTMEGHGGVWWYYLPVVLLSVIPFVHGFQSSFFRSFGRSENLLYAIWFLVVLILFSLSKTQLPHYILVAFFPLIWLLLKVNQDTESWALPFQVGLIQLVFMVAPVLAARSRLSVDDVFIQELLASSEKIFDARYFVVMVSLFLVNLLSGLFFRRSGLQSLLIFTASTAFFIFTYGNLQQGFVKETGLKLRNYPGDVYMQDHYSPSLSFYAQRTLTIQKEFTRPGLYFIRSDKTFNGIDLSAGSGFHLINFTGDEVEYFR